MDLNEYDFDKLEYIVKLLENEGYKGVVKNLNMIIRKLKRD